jgi:hypothetical protein
VGGLADDVVVIDVGRRTVAVVVRRKHPGSAVDDQEGSTFVGLAIQGISRIARGANGRVWDEQGTYQEYKGKCSTDKGPGPPQRRKHCNQSPLSKEWLFQAI